MTATLVLAAVLAALCTTFLGLVDAGRELDATLSRFEAEAAALHRATGDTVQHGAPADAIARPRTSLKRMIDSLPANADRIVRSSAPRYVGGLASSLADRIDLRPASDDIDRAYSDYLDQTAQAQAEKARTAGAIELRSRLLDLSHGMLAQRISEARERTRRGVASALNGLQLITFISIGIAALAVGLTGDR